MTAPVVVARDLVKSFGATRAVRGVSLEIPAGAIVGLVGENGAGKSTLAKMLAGVTDPDRGELSIRGRVVSLRSPHDGLKAGVSMMAQEIMLVPDRSVQENVLLGNLPRRGPFLDRRAMRRRYEELVELTGFALAPTARVSSLRIADQQKVEIMRALAQDAALIIMDEPSAALSTDEVAHLHQTMRTLTARGSAILLISHFLDEVIALTDQVLVMRDGEIVRCGPTAQESTDTLVTAMVGRALNVDYHTPHPQAGGPEVLAVEGLTRFGVLDEVSFGIREGEILGLAGLIGSGRSEIARCLFGADPKDRGTVTVDGTAVTARSPGEAIAQGIFMIPENRKEQGLVMGASIADNLLLSTLRRRARRGLLTRRAHRGVAAGLAESVDLRFGSVDQAVASLSGGNQQKVLFGRAREVAPRVLIVDEPTRGVDIAAKRAIHDTLGTMAAAGMAVLFISSELEEVLGVCGRVLVVHRGRIQAEFAAPYDRADVLAAFFGHGRQRA